MNATSMKTYQRIASECRDQLILGNLDYVARILSTMAIATRDEETRENLNSAGVVGLIEAANGFDPNHGVAFRTYAYPRIRGAIVDELRKQSPVSQKVLRQIGMIQRSYEELEPPVTPETLSEKTGLKIDEVNTCLEAMRFIRPDHWNDLSDVVHGSWREDANLPHQALETEEVKVLLAQSIEKLPDQERLVLTLYYSEELNLAEIGCVLDLSESRVSRILASARFRLQEIFRCKTK